MKKILILVFLVIGGGVLAAAVGQASKKTYSWRYKMTVEIETPEGIKTGSSVREVTILFMPTGNTHPKDRKYNNYISMKGEAVVVDLGERGTVFAILSGPLLGVDYGKRIPFYVFPHDPPGGTIEGAKYYSELKGKKVLEPTYYPMFVTFTDLDDPKSVVSLLRYKSNDSYPRKYTIEENYFEKYFGQGVKLKSVTLEMTDEEVIWKIKPYLQWLHEFYNKRLDGNRYGSSDAIYKTANALSSGLFATGKEK